MLQLPVATTTWLLLFSCFVATGWLLQLLLPPVDCRYIHFVIIIAVTMDCTFPQMAALLLTPPIAVAALPVQLLPASPVVFCLCWFWHYLLMLPLALPLDCCILPTSSPPVDEAQVSGIKYPKKLGTIFLNDNPHTSSLHGNFQWMRLGYYFGMK